ncbi:MAG: hypothetical protein JKY54_04835 [Flavobacteriales bacterium]|nr:hypothetical protein [Flavobacteriales bacterium]
MTKSIVRNLKKFLFEFVIVTLGILTAFSINKWDENEKLIVEEKKAYISFKKDLKLELYVLNYYKQSSIKGSNYLKPIIEENYKDLDTLEHYLQIGFDLQEGNATYVNLKYSGKLGILKNQDIKTHLILYYETYYQGLEKISKTNYDFLFNFLKPYFFKKVKYNYTREDILNHLKESEFLNLIKSQNDMLEYNISIIEKSENLINRIIKFLNKELQVEE